VPVGRHTGQAGKLYVRGNHRCVKHFTCGLESFKGWCSASWRKL
jgi:hypothetical protein